MRTIILWVLLILVPFWVGRAALRILYGAKGQSGLNREDNYLTGICVCIGVGEGANLLAVSGRFSLNQAGLVMGILLLGGSLVSFGIWSVNRFRGKQMAGSLRETKEQKKLLEGHFLTAGQQLVFIFCGISILVQLVVIMLKNMHYPEGDMTLETVQSFLAQNSVWTVDPLTGNAFLQGVPLRIKLLCLPTIYACLGKGFGTDPLFVTGGMIPAVVLLGSYLAYDRLGSYLFGKSKEKRGLFLFIVSLLFWLGTYMTQMDGFGLLYRGYAGTTIRAAILLPYTICMGLKKRWKSVFLCVLAEACIVWTLYGAGLCLAAGVLLFAISLVSKALAGGEK